MKRAVALSSLLLVACLPLPAEIITPGIYYGQPRIDRWGRPLLQWGPGAFFLSEEAWEGLRKLEGAMAAVDVTEIVWSRVGGIASAEALTTSTAVEIALDSSWARSGEGVLVTLLAHNRSEPPIWWPPRSVVLVVAVSGEAAQTPFAAPGAGTADDPWRVLSQPAWYHADWIDLQDPSDQASYAAFEVPVEWSAVELRHLDPCGFPRLPPGHTVIQEAIVGTDLPPGEYEVFAYWEMPHPSGQRFGPTSNVVPFDVWEP